MNADDVTPNFNPKADCPCGCGLFGTLRVKAWSDGSHHVRLCGCRRCQGGRQRPKSRRRENRVAKDTGGTREPLSGGLSGVDGRAGLWVWEETANVAIVRGLRRWWESKTVQSKLARMMARPGGEARAFIASWDGKPRLVVMLYEDWAGQVKQEVEAS